MIECDLMSAADDQTSSKPAVANSEGAQRSNDTLTRLDIAEAIFDRCQGMSKREAKRLVDSVIDEMVGVLCRGETLKLHDFGSFVVRKKGERAGRNPRTGAKVPIEPRKVVVFKASPNMKARVNRSDQPKSGPRKGTKSAKKH